MLGGGHRSLGLAVAIVVGLLAVGVASPVADAEGTATAPLAVGSSDTSAIDAANPERRYALDLDLAERVELRIDVPFVAGLTARVFRPGEEVAPRYTLRLAKGATTRSFTADWPGRWVVEISGTEPAAFTLGATRIAAGTPGAVTGGLTVATADGLAEGARLPSSTLDPDDPGRRASRFAWVEAQAGDRVEVAVEPTNGIPVTVEAFVPGTSEDDVATTDPAAVLTTSGAGVLAFDATLDGDWIIRVVPAPGTTRAATFLWALQSVAPRDPASTCDDDVTDIGLVRVTGCVTTGRGQVTATQPISFSGVDIIPTNGSTVRVEADTLEVSSDGTFDVNIAGMRILTGTTFFVLRGTRSYTVPDDTVIEGLPVEGRISATWSLENGGTLAVTGNVKLVSLGTSGDLSLEASSDLGLRDLRVRVAVDDLQGLAFRGTLGYRQERIGGEEVHVWDGGLSVSVGVAGADTPENVLPASLVGAAGELEFRNGRLAFLRVAVNTNIPIGATGLVVTQLGAGLRWDPHFMVSGTGTVALGPEVNGAAVLAIRGAAGWSEGGSCPGAPTTGPNWFGEGEARIAGWFSILSLDACYQQGPTAYTVIRGRSGFGYEDIVTGTARFDGYIVGRQAMTIEGSGALTVWGVGTEGRVVLSDAGLAACGEAYVNAFGLKRRVEVGAERRWADKSGGFAFSCPDFAPYRTVATARATRADGVPVTVPAGVDQVNLVVRGAAGAVPGVDVVGPDGTIVAGSTSTTAPSLTGAVFAPNADTGEMQIALPVGSPGVYRILPKAGSTISRVQSSLPRPEATVTARVVRTATGARTLTYRVEGLDGRRVRFTDTWRGRTRTLATTTRADGTLRLAATKRGTHRIEAIVLDEQGLALPAQLVARYR